MVRLNLSWCKKLSPKALAQIHLLENLKELTLVECTKLTDEALITISGTQHRTPKTLTLILNP